MTFAYVLVAALVHTSLFASAQEKASIEQYLASHRSADPMVVSAVNAVQNVLPSLVGKDSAAAQGVRLFVTDFAALPTRLYNYRTDSCLAAHSPAGTPLIICSEAFLLESEIPIRAFESGKNLLSRESELLQFIRTAKNTPSIELQRLRSDKKLAAKSDQSAEHIGLHLRFALLFFASHELGHLASNTDFSHYKESERSTSPDAVRSAVLRTCRQADQFNRYGFGLPGLESSINTGEEPRKVEEKYRREVSETYDAMSMRFKAEEDADRFANDTMLKYLNSVGPPNSESALLEQHIAMETLFVMGIYRWYSSLIGFTDSNCGPLNDSRELAICMMQDRERYVAASRVFGDVHPFIFLRTIQAMNTIARQRMHYYDGTEAERSIWPDRKKLETGGLTAVHEAWRSGDLQRLALLRILMDTPVKFSYTACMTGWFLELDKRRGTPQLFMMFFEPIETAEDRMKEFR